MRKLILSIAFTLGVTSPAFAQAPDAGIAPAVAVQPAVPSPASGSAAAAPSTDATVTTTTTTEIKPSDAVSNPAEHPVQAWDEAKAARKGGWAMLVFFCLVALTKALAYGRDKLQGMPGIGWIAARLAKGKTAMLVAGFGAVAVAGYDVLVGGGSVTAALFAAGVALAGTFHSTTKGAA